MGNRSQSISLGTMLVSRTVPGTQEALTQTLLNNQAPEFSLVAGEPCPENGRSPGSVSTHHSSPRSDYATYTNSNHAAPSGSASPPEGFASHSLQTSDVVIHRKENEGFGFVIISSLNRPESGSTISKWLLRLPLKGKSAFFCSGGGGADKQVGGLGEAYHGAWKAQAVGTQKAP